jgi:UDP-2,3-diacylglucosamine hydrolase
MAFCFISDLHLQDDRPEITTAFVSFIENTASKAERLYVLGDFFEAWIGDDDETDLTLLVKKTLVKLSLSTDIYAMHGNRDFLIGSHFAQEAGLILIDDPKKEQMFGNPVLLMHGDLLCTDDVDYQSFRATTRSPSWRKEFLSKPISERKGIAKELRAISKEATGQKKEDIMDVSENEVSRVMEEFSVNLLIHGHTHRPDTHVMDIRGVTSKRIVLGDWDEQGWFIWMDANSCELKKFPIS